MRVLPGSLYLGVALAVAHLPSPAEAARAPEALRERKTLEVAESGDDAKRAPRAQSPRWGALEGERAGAWRVMWNPQTGVPQRIFGRGTPAPGAVRSAARAEAHARRALREHLEILAPGSREADFELVANHLGATGMRTVAFAQRHDGMPVIGGQVNFRFRQDRLFMMGSEALPHVAAPPAIASISGRVARERARRWVEADFGARTTPPSAASGPYVLPIIRGRNDIEYRTVKSVQVGTPAIPASWEVFVDAGSGEPVARRQTLAFASGTVLFDVPTRRPGGERADLPASFLSIAVDGAGAVTDFFGEFAGPSGSSEVSFGIEGPLVAVENTAGNNATATRTFADGATEIFADPDSEVIDSQLTLFVHANRVKDYVRQYTDNPWLDEQLQVNANLDDSCNAFYSGQTDTINFFTEGEECNNTGRLVDVVYHEFGHAIHANAIIPGVGAFDGALSEGVSDYLAASINDDPGMGRGFFLEDPGAPLRHIDPEALGEPRPVFPDDFEGTADSVHSDGQIIAVTLWKLREELIAEYGEAEGVARSDEIWYGVIQRATDMNAAYAEALATDDDDGDLSNGTPNDCLIKREFFEGGLGGISLGLEPPSVDGYDVALPAIPDDGCDIASIEAVDIHWQRREDPATSGSEPLANVDGGGYAGQLPEQPDETVLEYQVQVAFDSGAVATFPENPADDQYELFVGATEDIYATPFDADPFQEGWTSGAEVGDDAWAWGEPGDAGLGGGPTAAYAGSRVLSTGLDTGGLYPSDSLTWVESPAIDISGLDNARLQFRRWLAVEDGFFDRARIYVNGELVWENADSDQGNASDVHHLDEEWRFQDIDLTEFIGDGTVEVRFEIESDAGLEFAGWAIDDFRIVTYESAPAECPDWEAGEVCDGECPPGCEPPPDDDDDGGGDPGAGGDVGDASGAGCGCSAGQTRLPDPGALVLGSLLLVGVAALRRRRPQRAA